MKKGFINKILAATLTAAMVISAAQSVLADIIVIDKDEFIDNARHYKQNYTFVDLTGVANRAFADEVAGDGKGGWSDQGPSNDMAIFNSYGVQNFSGLEFKVINPKENNNKSCIMMSGRGDPNCPTDLEIPVNAKAKGIYFLNSCPYSSIGMTAGTYTVVYDDGTEEVITLVVGENISDWWGGVFESDTAVRVWSGLNNSSTVGLDATLFSNPNPDKEIKSIKVHTPGGATDPYLGIVSITLTDTDPYLPIPKKVVQGNLYDSTWYPYYVPVDPWAIEGTPLDASNLLEKPSGQHGRVTVEGDRLKFADGTDCQFWGTNVPFDHMLMTKDDARATARRMALLGFNCVRFHITTAVVKPHESTREIGRLSMDNMDKLGYFLNELKKNGLYYGFDLPWGNLYKNSDIKYYDKANASAIKYYDPDYIEILDAHAKQFLTWENPYTGMSIAEDPSAVWASLYNESTIFRNAELGGDEYHDAEIQQYFNDWLKEKYPTRDALKLAWYMPDSNAKALEDGEDQFEGTVKIYGSSERRYCNKKRYDDMIAFLGDMERKTYHDRFMRIKEYAPDILLLGTTSCPAGGSDVYTSYFYTDVKESDIFTFQNYWYLPFGNGEAVEAGTKHDRVPVSTLANYDKTMYAMGYIAGQHMAGRPYFMTEWDSSQVNPYRSEAFLEMASFARTNYINPFHFNWVATKYDERALLDKNSFRMNRGHDSNYKPDIMQVFPTLARMVLRKDLKESEKGYYTDRYYGQDVYDSNKQGLRADMRYAACGKSTVVMDDICFDKDFTSNDVLKLEKYGEKTGRFISNTDETMVDYNDMIYYVNSPRSQAVTGYIGGKKVEMDDVIFEMETKHTTLYMSSLTNDSLTDTDSMLFTYVGDNKNNGMKLTDDAFEILEGGVGPIVVQPVIGKITLKSKDNFKVYMLDFTGHRKGELPTGKDENGFTYFETKAEHETMNYEVVRTAKSGEDFTPKKISYLPDGIFDDLYTDLGKYEPYKKEIERISLQGYIKPVFEHEFYPEQGFTRGDAVSVLKTVFGIVSSEKDPGFADVPKDSKYYDVIAAAAAAGMISSDAENFRPDDFITREEFAAMVYNGIKTTNMLHPDERGTAVPNLSRVSDFAKEAVSELVKHGYCDEVNSLDMKSALTRADAAIVLYRILWE